MRSWILAFCGNWVIIHLSLLLVHAQTLTLTIPNGPTAIQNSATDNSLSFQTTMCVPLTSVNSAMRNFELRDLDPSRATLPDASLTEAGPVNAPTSLREPPGSTIIAPPLPSSGTTTTTDKSTKSTDSPHSMVPIIAGIGVGVILVSATLAYVLIRRRRHRRRRQMHFQPNEEIGPMPNSPGLYDGQLTPDPFRADPKVADFGSYQSRQLDAKLYTPVSVHDHADPEAVDLGSYQPQQLDADLYAPTSVHDSALVVPRIVITDEDGSVSPSSTTTFDTQTRHGGPSTRAAPVAVPSSPPSRPGQSPPGIYSTDPTEAILARVDFTHRMQNLREMLLRLEEQSASPGSNIYMEELYRQIEALRQKNEESEPGGAPPAYDTAEPTSPTPVIDLT